MVPVVPCCEDLHQVHGPPNSFYFLKSKHSKAAAGAWSPISRRGRSLPPGQCCPLGAPGSCVPSSPKGASCPPPASSPSIFFLRQGRAAVGAGPPPPHAVPMPGPCQATPPGFSSPLCAVTTPGGAHECPSSQRLPSTGDTGRTLGTPHPSASLPPGHTGAPPNPPPRGLQPYCS